MSFVIGLDLGQRADFTAVAVLERTETTLPPLPGARVPRPSAIYAVRQLDRVRQESYEQVADGVADLLRRRAQLRGADLVVDASGVGIAVTDMLRARGLTFQPVTITGGERMTVDEGRWRVPKRDLVAVVAVLLEGRRLAVAAGLPLAETLRDELLNFRIKLTPSGHDAYGAGTDWREGQHDDLVLAVALAAWWAERGGPAVTAAWQPFGRRRDVLLSPGVGSPWSGASVWHGGPWSASPQRGGPPGWRPG
jgi:hypothetical protein